MAVRIRLKRFGTTKKPFWRIVVADNRSPRDGRCIEEIGFYDPKPNPMQTKVKKERAKYWLSVGAQLTPVVKSIFKREGIKKTD